MLKASTLLGLFLQVGATVHNVATFRHFNFASAYPDWVFWSALSVFWLVRLMPILIAMIFAIRLASQFRKKEARFRSTLIVTCFVFFGLTWLFFFSLEVFSRVTEVLVD
jgi:hypothetical protein